MLKRISLALLILVVLGACAAVGGWTWLKRSIEPMPAGPARYLRFEDGQSLQPALERLHAEGFIRNADALRYYARLNGKARPVRSGTYLLRPGMTADEVLASLDSPVKQMVRLPETTWAAQKAKVLEEKLVTPAEEYLALVQRPTEFADTVQFKLPSDSLEGYLYPDTYDLPPLLGARATVLRQLKNFESKVWEGLGEPENLHRAVIVASMVELEVQKDDERPIVAGVIENRLRKGMPLQIDATILYGLQKWRRMTYEDYKVESPYNTYLHKGLPPGPVCSPSLQSIKAALKPASHNYLFYVALPDGSHVFTESYDQHLGANRRAKAAWRLKQEGIAAS